MAAFRMPALGQSGIFDCTGIIPGHGFYSSVPEERVDLFTGNLTLRYLDIFLPGPNELNIEVWRVYNSKILRDKQSGNLVVQAYPKSMVGIGWMMHMGMVHNFTSNTPVIEFADGRREMAFPPKSEYGYGSSICITRDFMKYNKGLYPIIDPKLYFKNGNIWTFGNSASLPLGNGSSETVLMVTRIQDSYGNYISIEYDPDDNYRSIKKISDSMGREVRFAKSYQGSNPAKLAEIRIRNYDDSHDIVCSYSVDSFANGYYKLSSFTPPILPATTYEYDDGQSCNYELKKLTMSYGGMLEYVYENHNFYFNSTMLDSRVVAQKKITFNPGEQAKVWNFTYPTYQGVTSGTANVQGPEYSAQFTHFAYDNAYPWRIGLESSQAVSDGSYSDVNVWTYQQISNTNWYVLGTNMGTAKGPLASSVDLNRTGDATLKTQYYYDRVEAMKYGFPTKIGYFINGSGSAKSYKELTYYYESHGSFKDKYILSLLGNEKDKSGTGIVQKETILSYYDEEGKWGAVKQLKRWKSATYYYVWDYTYSGVDPKNITITIDSPGEEGVSTVIYKYGVESSRSTQDFQKFERNISKYSYILREYNKVGGNMVFIYDDLGRITSVDLSGTFNTINAEWRPNNENMVIISQGENTITKLWDGLGRDTGFMESGDGTTLYYRNTLDAEGRIRGKTSGSIDPSHKYLFLLDAAGRATQITNPKNEVATISYSGIALTLTDPKNHSTSYEYNDLPGLPTKLTDAQNRVANYTYDAIGRLKTVVYNAARTQSYEYDGMSNVTSETHPETGTITYYYNSANRLSSKNWGGTTQNYYYNASGQLTRFVGSETVTYGYRDKNGYLESITGSAGWSRSGYLYNQFGALIQENILVPGLSLKTINYGYDNNNNLITTTYPDGKVVDTPYNGLKRPESLTFSQTTLIENASYGPNKMLASMSIVGNGTSFASTYLNDGKPITETLSMGGSSLYNVSYTYDGAGNIMSISSSAPSPSLNATFSYDALNRLTTASYTSGRVSNYSYEYDEYGNMKTVKENGINVFSRTYDASNRIIGYSYDARGNLTAAEGKSFFWDAQNRLAAVMDATGQYLADYRYDDTGLRITSLPPVPDIEIEYYPTGSSVDLTGSLNTPAYRTFTIDNLGHANLVLSDLSISGTDAALFSVFGQPNSPVPPNQSTTFTIQFLPTSTGDKTALLSIASNDPNENPYTIDLTGYCEPQIAGPESQDFGTVTIFESTQHTLYIQNIGAATLVLYGWPISIEEQHDQHCFYLEGQTGSSRILPNGSNTFTVRFAPKSEGPKTATISIENNDLDENPYVITLTGVGEADPRKVSEKSSLIIVCPNGGEELEASAVHNINWKGGDAVKYVKIEYSTDNGSTYHTIAERAVNIGTYPWQVPSDLSESCLVRISDADGAPTMPLAISYEFNFRVSIPEGESLGTPHFTFLAGLPDLLSQSYKVAEVSFAPDGLSGCENLLFNYSLAEVQGLGKFLETWHHAQITYDMTNYSGSVWIDNQPVLSSVPLNTDLDVQRPPEISLSGNPKISMKLWIDDVEVKFLDQHLMTQDSTEIVFRPLFKDNFNRYEIAFFPRNGGWLSGKDLIAGDPVSLGKHAQVSGGVSERATAELQTVGSAIDDEAYASSSKSFKLEHSGDEAGVVVKRFSTPARTPFCVSEECFSIITQSQQATEERGLLGLSDRERLEEREGRRDKRESNVTNRGRGLSPKVKQPEPSKIERSSVRSAASGGKKSSGLLSGVPVGGAFYIYSFDGRLLAEYDTLGGCVRDYIYFGGQLIGEYQTIGANLYYYTFDQINSTRIVTDSTGTVVYSAAYDPYGGIQKTWTSTYDPLLKFSGKERDTESELDYFGARYYNRAQYGFISVDPIISLKNALSNPQRWNLYSCSVNNPISGIDPDGKDTIISVYRVFSNASGTTGVIYSGGEFFGTTSELPWLDNTPFVSCIPLENYPAHLRYRKDFRYDIIELENVEKRIVVQIHPRGNRNEGCIGMEDKSKFDKLMDRIRSDKKIVINFPADGSNPTFKVIQGSISVELKFWIFYPNYPQAPRQLTPVITWTVVINNK
jgi:RHS repeat-associated protein